MNMGSCKQILYSFDYILNNLKLTDFILFVTLAESIFISKITNTFDKTF